MRGSKFGIRGPFTMKKNYLIGIQIFSLKCGFGIGYGIGRKYWPIWVSVSVSDLNQNSGVGRTLDCLVPYSTFHSFIEQQLTIKSKQLWMLKGYLLTYLTLSTVCTVQIIIQCHYIFGKKIFKDTFFYFFLMNVGTKMFNCRNPFKDFTDTPWLR